MLAAALCVFGVAGALWGWLRPVQHAHPDPGSDGGFVVDPADHSQFFGYGTFAAATGILGALFAISVFVLRPRLPGLGTLIWLLISVAAGGIAFVVVGDVVAAQSVHVGAEEATLVAPVAPGIAFAAGPFMAALAFWCAVFVAEDYPGRETNS
ncbi:hypothetical protein [Corynebacterium massiliense]|uniref:DUF2567 domain-containing protein n=1 Tax=Corynebacterium massiliense DSM 45435 TaxID=1121364 RepID=A0ABY7U7X6_9CORY|nr:hypothetical protein [Corynebacterium massiliense]WCZ32813.1 hypothetical protein CMASS_06895 [Corynebacterium massiliense DSM 45435]